MAVLTATTPVDMTDWNFDNINAGTITAFTSLKYAIDGGDGDFSYEFGGVGLTYNGSHELTGGVVTSYRVFDSDGNVILSVSGLNIAGNKIQSAIDTNNSTGIFETNAFAHANTFNGSSGDDVLQAFSAAAETLNGGDGNDVIIDFTPSVESIDTINGGAGDDTVLAGAHWDGHEVNGGEGYDTIVFDGNYPVALNITNAFTSVEQLTLLGGPRYSILSAFDDLVAAGETLHVDGSALGVGSGLDFDGHNEADGQFELMGGAGNDNLRGGQQTDTFWLDVGGRDRVAGIEGDDLFMFGSKLTGADRIRAGIGFDTIVLDGNYSSLVLEERTLKDVDVIEFVGGHNYTVTLANGNVAPGDSLTFAALTSLSTDVLVIDASALVDGAVGIIDGQGNDVLTGGTQDDQFILSGGQNTVNGGAGDDAIEYLGLSFSATESLNGGAGEDKLVFIGDHSGGVTLAASAIASIEALSVGGAFDYVLTFEDALLAAGKTFTASADDPSLGLTLSADNSFSFTGSAELDGKFVLVGGDGDDTLTGGAKNDTVTGGLGADLLTAGLGNDTYVYATAGVDSTGVNYDTIDGFDGSHDNFDVGVLVAARDATIATGTLSKATFDTDLAFAADAAHLLANHCVLYKPNAGSLAGTTFLVVDQDGLAGYSVDADLVIQLTTAINTAAIGAGTFI